MDKIVFLNELCTISDNPNVNKDNFEKGMMFERTINTFYEILKYVSEVYNANNEIVVAPTDFSVFSIPPGEFRFMFSKKVKSIIDCTKPIYSQDGCVCYIRKNETEAGYIVSIQN